MQLGIWLDQDLVAHLGHDAATNRFALAYTPKWRGAPRSFPLSPQLPLEPPADQSKESHSAQVRQFFENLLPEGEALDHAASAARIAKSNLVGLIIALGKETAGAVRVTAEGTHIAPPGGPHHGDEGLRLVTPEQLSERIRNRAETPFSVWDGKVRLSIAGHQDKIAVYERGEQWYLVDGGPLASTVIVKPVPRSRSLASLPANEYTCMQLAERVGLQVPRTRLVHVPEAVLLVDRFDRIDEQSRVRRLHVIDGCQALGLSVSMKYERPYGDGRDVQHYRTGVSYAQLFRLLDQSPQPAVDKQALLRWAMFQVLVGNTDAHGKNLSFFCDVQGLRLAPAYDLVCTAALGAEHLSDTYALAVGNAFRSAELTPYEWATFARQCAIPIRMVSQQLRQLAVRMLNVLDDVVSDVVSAGVPREVAQSIAAIARANCQTQFELAPGIARVKPTDV